MPDIEKVKGKSEGKPATKREMRGRGIAEAEAIDLDVTPVMNLFLVLIPFLVSMAIFTHMAIVEFSLPPAAPSAEETAGDANPAGEMDISIVITRTGYTIVGSGQKLPLVPKSGDQYDFSALVSQLRAIKFKYPRQESVILVIDPRVIYDDIIHFMDKCRESQFPNIALSGGFQ